MREKIIEILDDLITEDVDIATCQELIDGDYLDSFAIVALVTDLNDEFDVAISVIHLVPENFNSVDAIESLVKSLQK